jgi:hypothetical protein
MTKKTWVLISALLLAGAGYLLTLRWRPSREEIPGGRLTKVRAAGGRLQARAWVAGNRVSVGGPVTFWIAFANDSDKPISGFSLVAFEAPEFGKFGKCWEGGVPVCENQQRIVLPLTLPAGGSTTLSADLTAPPQVGIFAPTLVFQWRAASGAPIRDALTLGPIEVTSLARERMRYFATRGRDLLKDIAIPLALFLLGVLVQRETQRHAERGKLAEEKRTQINQIWQNLLPQSLSDAQKYYMPVLSPLLRLDQYWPHAATDVGARNQCLYAFLLFLRRMKFLVDNIASFQFRNRAGESIAAQAYLLVRVEVEAPARFRAEDFELAMRKMKPQEDFAAFRARFEPTAPPDARLLFTRLDTAFHNWIRGTPAPPFADYLPLLRIISAVVEFEVNRPFEYWYGQREPFPEEGLTQAQTELSQLPSGDAVKSLKRGLSEYLRTKGELPNTPGGG